jgi:PAS domain S-box-containing protein
MSQNAGGTVPYWGRVGLFALGYLVCAAVGLAVTFAPAPFVSFWLPGGLFVATLLRNDNRQWPGFLAAALAANVAFDLWNGQRLGTSALFWCGNAAEATLGAWLVRRVTPPFPDLSSVRDVVGLLLCAGMISPVVGATVGASVVQSLGGGHAFWPTWFVWWIGDAVGVLLVAPLVLCARRPLPWPPRWSIRKPAEAALFVATLAASILFVFGDAWNRGARVHHLLVPILVWAAFRFGPRGTAITNAAIGVAAASAASFGFYRMRPEDASPTTQAVTLLSLIVILAPTGLLLAAIVSERQKAERAAQVAAERLTRAQQGAGMGHWDWDMASGRLDWSPELFRLFGLEPDPARATFETWRALVHPDDAAAAEARIRTAVEARTPLESEYRVVHPSGDERWISALGRAAYAADGTPISMSGICLDITLRRQVEAALRSSEATLRSLFDAISESVFMIDTEGVILAANRTFAERLGRTVDSCLGTRVWDLLPPEVAERRRSWTAMVMEADGAMRVEDRRGDVWFDNNLCPVRGPDGTISRLVVVATDTTERKQAEEALERSRAELQALSRQLVTLEEESRREIARELHDRVGQNLTALNLNFAIIQGLLSRESADRVRDRLDDSLLLLTEAMTQVRDVMAELRPPLLDEYGLATALKWYAAQAAGRFGLGITVDADEGGPRYPAGVETVCFRVAQEAITNVARHARARTVRVGLAALDAGVRLAIADDGVGVDLGKLQASAGWGITLMRERAESVGARFAMTSRPGEGTTVTVSWLPADTGAPDAASAGV